MQRNTILKIMKMQKITKWKVNCSMKKYYLVSLCKNGILGGYIIADEEAITYKTGKVTIPREYKFVVFARKSFRELLYGKGIRAA